VIYKLLWGDSAHVDDDHDDRCDDDDNDEQ
jgi:hypothetical protein